MGMAAMLAGVCQVPLTSVLLLFELTQDYRIILPLMWAVGVSSWIASSFNRKSRRTPVTSDTALPPSLPLFPQSVEISDSNSSLIYISLPKKMSLISKDGNGGLQSIRETLTEKGTATDLLIVSDSLENLWEEKDLCNVDGSLCLANLEISEEQLAEEIPVAMAMRTRFATVSPETTVREAMTAMLSEKEWCVLLLDTDRRLLGLLTLADIQQAAGSARMVGLQMEVCSPRLPVI